MPASHLCLHYHLVFSTHEREPWLSLDWRRYIERHAEHHRKKTLLQEAGIAHDEVDHW